MMNPTQMPVKPSSFISGAINRGAAYNMTVLTNHAGANALLNRDPNFVEGIIEKLLFESNKVDDARQNWRNHEYKDQYPAMEIKALAGWPFVVNISMSRASMDLLADDDERSVEFLTNKLSKEIEYLSRRFPIKTDFKEEHPAVSISAPETAPAKEETPTASAPETETPKPKRVRKPAEPKAEKAPPKKRASKKKEAAPDVPCTESAPTVAAETPTT